MKDYLKEPLSQEERLIILGIIWKVARVYKRRSIEKSKRYCELIEELDLTIEDTYTFSTYNLINKKDRQTKLTEKEKCDIVMNVDFLLRELCLFELIRTLTFTEKLVFFLFYLEDYKNIEVAILLGNTEKTILSKRKSINKKIEDMKGDFKDE